MLIRKLLSRLEYTDLYTSSKIFCEPHRKTASQLMFKSLTIDAELFQYSKFYYGDIHLGTERKMHVHIRPEVPRCVKKGCSPQQPFQPLPIFTQWSRCLRKTYCLGLSPGRHTSARALFYHPLYPIILLVKQNRV